MKKRTSLVVVTLFASVVFWGEVSVAGNPAFSVSDEQAIATGQPSRFFVKYHKGSEQQVREILASYQLDIVDMLEEQQVFVVSGETDAVNALIGSEVIDYVEPEPKRRLYSQ